MNLFHSSGRKVSLPTCMSETNAITAPEPFGVMALFIAIESGMRFLEPVQVAFGEATLVAIVGLVINIISAFLLGHDHSHDHGHGHDHGDDHHHGHADNNLRAAYVHVLTDALTSVLAIAALLAGRYLGWWWLDPAVGILGSIVIARWAWGLMKDTAAILLDTAEPALTAKVRALAETEGATIRDLQDLNANLKGSLQDAANREKAAKAEAATAQFEERTAAARAEVYRQMDDMRRAALERRAELVARTRQETATALAEATEHVKADAAEARARLAASSRRRRSAPIGKASWKNGWPTCGRPASSTWSWKKPTGSG